MSMTPVLLVVLVPVRCELAFVILFFFNDTATTEIYTLSLHDALPIYLFPIAVVRFAQQLDRSFPEFRVRVLAEKFLDRKSTRLNSSHQIISYAVFCLKKKKKE